MTIRRTSRSRWRSVLLSKNRYRQRLRIRVIGAGAGHLPAPHFDFCLGATESQVAARRRWLQCVKNLGIKAVLTAARSPWQNPYVERLIGSIRRECLDHVIVLNEQYLRRVLRSYFAYYHRSRCHTQNPTGQGSGDELKQHAVHRDIDTFPDSITARSINFSRCPPAWRIWAMLSF
jgi:transposase InsO family protein